MSRCSIGRNLVITGHVDPDSAETKVSLLVNGSEIASTGAGRAVRIKRSVKNSGFRFNVEQLESYLGAGDRIQLRHGDQIVPIEGHGEAYTVTKGASRMGSLFTLLKNGHSFMKNGKLRRGIGHDEGRLNSLFESYWDIADFLHDKFGLSLFLCYGTLLGCIRDKDFIKHDDDFDCSYISNYSSREDVISELSSVASALIGAGYIISLSAAKYVIKVKHPSSKCSFDLYYSWFNEDGSLDISFGYHGRQFVSEDRQFPVIRARMRGREVLVPKHSESFLEQLYGEGWRIPDQGFSHAARTQKRRLDFAIPAADALKIYWNNFYHHNSIQAGSAFAVEVAQACDPSSLVVEFGCGNGRDATFFARSGFRTLATDMSEEAIEAASSAAAKDSLDKCTFAVSNVSSASDLDKFLSHPDIASAVADGVPIVVYCRFFLHAIEEDSERELFLALRRNLMSYELFAEFRTDQDKDIPKAHGTSHFRRYINPDEIERRMTSDYGLHILSSKSGFGMSIYKDEDPHLCRIKAKSVTPQPAG